MLRLDNTWIGCLILLLLYSALGQLRLRDRGRNDLLCQHPTQEKIKVKEKTFLGGFKEAQCLLLCSQARVVVVFCHFPIDLAQHGRVSRSKLAKYLNQLMFFFKKLTQCHESN